MKRWQVAFLLEGERDCRAHVVYAARIDEAIITVSRYIDRAFSARVYTIHSATTLPDAKTSPMSTNGAA